MKLTPRREDGWLALKEWLKVSKGESKLTISRKCKNLIRSMSQLMHDTKNPCDAATVPHEITHAPDALRYFASYLLCEDQGSTGGRLFEKIKNTKGRFI